MLTGSRSSFCTLELVHQITPPFLGRPFHAVYPSRHYHSVSRAHPRRWKTPGKPRAVRRHACFIICLCASVQPPLPYYWYKTSCKLVYGDVQFLDPHWVHHGERGSGGKRGEPRASKVAVPSDGMLLFSTSPFSCVTATHGHMGGDACAFLSPGAPGDSLANRGNNP
jgi:hypothetical protein